MELQCLETRVCNSVNAAALRVQINRGKGIEKSTGNASVDCRVHGKRFLASGAKAGGHLKRIRLTAIS